MTDVAGVTSARDRREERWRGGGEHQEGRGRLCVCLCVCVGGEDCHRKGDEPLAGMGVLEPSGHGALPL